jgi:hypothetical protein
MRFPPEAFLIGAMKAGTTSLAHLLDRHPKITLAQPKEPDYFTRHFHRGMDWYKTVFASPPDAVLLDASNSYTAAPVPGVSVEPGSPDFPFIGVPGRIHAINPRPKFVYVLRDPVTRTYSAYWHMVRVGEETQDFRTAIGREDQFYLRISDYQYQLEKYLELFPPQSFLFLLFEEMVRDPARAGSQCFDFFGVEPIELTVDTASFRSNAAFTYTRVGRFLTRLFPTPSSWKAFTRITKGLVPELLVPLVSRAVARDIPLMSEADRRFLVDYFRDRNRRLEQVIGRRLDLWQS